MKSHEKLGPVGRQLCWLYDAWIIGGAARYIAGVESKVPNDIDIIVPLANWVQASKMIPEHAKANRFGGFKFIENGVEVDVWADDTARVIAYATKDIQAYNPRFDVLLGKVN